MLLIVPQDVTGFWGVLDDGGDQGLKGTDRVVGRGMSEGDETSEPLVGCQSLFFSNDTRIWVGEDGVMSHFYLGVNIERCVEMDAVGEFSEFTRDAGYIFPSSIGVATREHEPAKGRVMDGGTGGFRPMAMP